MAETVYDVLLVLIVALRVLIWDGAPGQFAETFWQLLVCLGLLTVAVDPAKRDFRWGWRGLLAGVLVLALLPAALMAYAPGPAWCRWTGWLGCLGAAAFLAQIIEGRQRLLVAALLAGGAGEILLALTQKLWVLPAMAQAQAGNQGAFAGLDVPKGDVAERISRGGVFGTFTLANQLGSYLVLILAVLVGTAWSSRRWWPLLPALAAVIALYLTDAKGAWLALAGAAGLAWFLALRGPWRWLPLPLGILAAWCVWHWGLAHASAQVRWGYWHGAVQLITQAPWSGHGLGGFATGFSQVMVTGDEPTRFAHNEVLEAAVAGGLGLGLMTLAWLVVQAWPRPLVERPHDEVRRPHPATMIALIVAVPYLAVFGMLDGNLGWWPMPVLLGALLLSGVMALAWWIGQGLAVPPAWALSAGLAAVSAKMLIDFDAQAAGIVGTAAMVAVLAAPRWRTIPGRGWSLGLALLLALALGISTWWGGRLARADNLLALDVAAAVQPEMREDLAQELSLPVDTPARELHMAACRRAWDLAAGDPASRLRALVRAPDLERASDLVRSAPRSAGARRLYAQMLLKAGRKDEAVEAMAVAVSLAPTDPGMHRAQAELLDAVGRPSAAARAEADRLTPLVDHRLR